MPNLYVDEGHGRTGTEFGQITVDCAFTPRLSVGHSKPSGPQREKPVAP